MPTGWANTEKTQQEYWNESGVKIEDIDYSQRDCYSTVMMFRACMAGVNALAAYLEPKARVLPNSLLGDKDIVQGDKIEAIGKEASLVKLSTDVEAEKNLRLFAQRKKLVSTKLKIAEEDLYKKIVKALNEDMQLAKEFIDFNALSKNFVAQIKANPKNKEELAYIAGKEANAGIRIVDAHGYLQPAAALDARFGASNKTFFGVGMEIHILNARPVLGGFVEGSSAQKSKLLKKNDVILEVDGLDTKDMSLEKVTNLIRGQEGTKVKLLVQRGEERKSAELVRAKVELKNVGFRVVKDVGSKKIGYIQLKSFTDSQGCVKINEAIAELHKKKVEGLILDLRGNSGGFIVQAQCIGGLFVGDQVIVGVKDLQVGGDVDTNEIQYERTLAVGATSSYYKAEQKTYLPLITLIDGKSASASEILAGAFQDLKRGWVLGETSYGKATVQAIHDIMENGVRLKRAKTVRRFYQPSGRTNQVVGIEPDFVTPFKPDATEDERFVLREGDQYENALPPAGAEWRQTRPQEVKLIQECIAQKKLAEKKYHHMNNDKDNEDTIDYQLLMAQEVLSCQ